MLEHSRRISVSLRIMLMPTDQILIANPSEQQSKHYEVLGIIPRTFKEVTRMVFIMKNAPKNIDEYIAGAPEKARSKLIELRTAIRETAPSAVESISYNMPYYNYKGRLAWFGLAKTHIGLYIRPPIIEEHRSELKCYQTTKSTVRFPLDKQLPIGLIKKLVKARMKKNDAENVKQS